MKIITFCSPISTPQNIIPPLKTFISYFIYIHLTCIVPRSVALEKPFLKTVKSCGISLRYWSRNVLLRTPTNRPPFSGFNPDQILRNLVTPKNHQNPYPFDAKPLTYTTSDVHLALPPHTHTTFETQLRLQKTPKPETPKPSNPMSTNLYLGFRVEFRRFGLPYSRAYKFLP